MALGNPYELEYEVMHMLLELDAGSLQCTHGIIELDAPESKKGNQHLLFRNLVRHIYSEEVEAREDGDFHLFQKLHRFLSKHSKIPKNGTLKPSVNKQGLFVNVKQTLNDEFINDTIFIYLLTLFNVNYKTLAAYAPIKIDYPPPLS